MTVRVGVIGTGNIGTAHVRRLAGQVSGARITKFFGTLGRLGFDGIMTVCVFAREDRARDSSLFMRERIESYTKSW